MLYVFLDFCLVLAYRIHVVASTPKLTISVFEFHIGELLIQHQTAFAFQIPYEAWNLLKIGTVFRNEWDSKLLRGGTL